MPNPNVRPSDKIALLGALNPVSQAAATVTSGWIDASQYYNFLALIVTGVLGASATIDAKLQQATDSSGTGVKDITGKAITQLVKASNDNNQAQINLRADELDINNGFNYFRLSVTVGTAASLIAAQIFGTDPRYAASPAASVVQTVA
jgi:hypothetical protein